MAVHPVTIGFRLDSIILSYIRSREKEKLFSYLRNDTYGRLLFTLGDYLIKYSKKFSKLSLHFEAEGNRVYPNGTSTGLLGKINQSRIDIAILPFTMNAISTEIVDFSYPYQLYYYTFVIRKPEYKPQLLGILQTFSLSTWATIISAFVMMLLLYYVILKQRYSLDTILLHIFAVFLRQSSIINPSSLVKVFLVYSWVVGAMFLCLAYESVFFSFLAIPPVTHIKDVSQLARAVEKGDYHCLADPQANPYWKLLQSQQENLIIIAKHLEWNNFNINDVFKDFSLGESKQDLAFLVTSGLVNFITIDKNFVSEDRFVETMAAMMVRKSFCCKNLLESFVHKMIASGIYFKYKNDRAFSFRLPLVLKHSEKDVTQRKLTLTDVAPAFIFLLTGYLISFLFFIGEILLYRRKKRNSFWEKKNRNAIKASNEGILMRPLSLTIPE